MIFSSPGFVFATWLCIVSIVGLARLYDAADPPAIGLTIISGTIFILLMNRFNKEFRKRFDATSTEQLICWHAIRAPIGAAFLVFASEGMLPELFAHRAGYGDLVAAFTGLIVVAVLATLKANRPRWLILLIWNVIGLIDLMLAVGTGIYCAVTVEGSMDWIVRLPLLLVPTFILPVLFSTHIIIFMRLFTGRISHSDDVSDPKGNA